LQQLVPPGLAAGKSFIEERIVAAAPQVAYERLDEDAVFAGIADEDPSGHGCPRSFNSTVTAA
jgi:hypothetical protein